MNKILNINIISQLISQWIINDATVVIDLAIVS